MKNYAKFEDELNRHFKGDMWKATNFDLSTFENLKTFHFDGFLLSKVYIA